MLADMLLANGFNRTSDACLQIDALTHLAKAALAEYATDFVFLAHIRCRFQALEKAELK